MMRRIYLPPTSELPSCPRIACPVPPHFAFRGLSPGTEAHVIQLQPDDLCLSWADAQLIMRAGFGSHLCRVHRFFLAIYHVS